jgi:crotonobetaine/carnitine-CoA ligase
LGDYAGRRANHHVARRQLFLKGYSNPTMTIQSNDMAPLSDLVGAEHATIPEVWEARAAATPDQVFLRYEEQAWTYGEAWAIIRNLAGYLKAATAEYGGTPRVASFLTNRPETFWIWFATQAAGGIYIPLNIAHRSSLLQDMICRVNPDILVTESELYNLLPVQSSNLTINEIILIEDAIEPSLATASSGRVLSLQSALNQGHPYVAHSQSPASIASIMFTSGSTGKSKPVMQPHNMFARGASHAVRAFGITSTDVIHYWFPMYHIGGMLHFGVSSVLAGATIALHKRFSASQFWAQIIAEKCTVFGGLPVTLSLAFDNSPAGDQLNEIKLRIGICGPAPEPNLVSRFENKFDVRIFDTYGMTEAEILTLPPPDQLTPPGSVGKASPDFLLSIVDEEGVAVSDGEIGEILVRPLQPAIMMTGYEGMPQETVSKFKDLWYHTGDLGFRDSDGFFYVRGRKNEVIRHRGENISIKELEALVLQHPGIKECVAVGVSSPLGEDDVKIVIVLHEKQNRFDIRQFHSWCKEQMAKFMVPRYIQIVDLVPTTDVGKINRKLLEDNPDDIFDAADQAMR